MSRVAKANGDGERQLTFDERSLYEVIRSSLYEISREADLEALADAIRHLDPDKLERALASIRLGVNTYDLAEVIRQVIVQSGITGQGALRAVIDATPRWGGPLTGTPTIAYAFNVTDPKAQRYAEFQAARLVTAITESNRLAIRQIINQAFTKQNTMDYTARRLRQFVGLHPRWALAVDKYHDRTYQNLIRQGIKPAAAAERALNITEKYRQKLIRARATMIARTEIQIAQNMGRQLGWDQARDNGYIDGTATKMWSATYRDNAYGPPCDRCSELNGVEVGVSEVFPNGLLMPPAHPHCRCTAVLLPPDRGLNDREWIATGVQR